MADRLLILDFDGTLCLGDGPVRAFAREVASAVGAPEGELLHSLDRFLRGEPGTEFDGCADAYTAVAMWARGRGLGRDGMTAAFLRGRAELDAEGRHGVDRFDRDRQSESRPRLLLHRHPHVELRRHRARL